MAIGPVGPRGEKAGQAGPRGEAPGSGGAGKGPGPQGEKVGQAGPRGETPGSGSSSSNSAISSSSSNSSIQGSDSVGDSAELKEAKKRLKADTEAGDMQAVQNDQAQIKKLQQQFAGMAG